MARRVSPGPWRSSWKSPGGGGQGGRSTARPSSGPWRSYEEGGMNHAHLTLRPGGCPMPPCFLASSGTRRCSGTCGTACPFLYRGGRPGLPHSHAGGGPRGGLPFAIAWEDVAIGSLSLFRQGTSTAARRNWATTWAGPIGAGDHDLGGGGGLPVAFAHTDLLRIYAAPFARNLPSCRVLEGWVPAGGHLTERGEGRGSAGYEAYARCGRPPDPGRRNPKNEPVSPVKNRLGDGFFVFRQRWTAAAPCPGVSSRTG